MRRENSTEPSLIPDDLASPQSRLEQANRRRAHASANEVDPALPESRNFLWLDDHAEVPERWDGLA